MSKKWGNSCLPPHFFSVSCLMAELFGGFVHLAKMNHSNVAKRHLGKIVSGLG